MNKKNKQSKQGFTLVELLIVVALLGALAALMLPSFKANRVKAMEATCDYNQASTIKTLLDNYSLSGALPNKLHNGLTNATVAATADNVMALPEFTQDNMVDNTSAHTLTETEADSLNAAGLTEYVYGDASTVEALTNGVSVLVLDGWTDDAEEDVTFDGLDEDAWEGTSGEADEGIIIPMFVSQATDWSSSSDNDWGVATDSSISVKKAGSCLVPIDADFSYYIAYIKAFSNTVDDEAQAAILVGTSCPECGITNP